MTWQHISEPTTRVLEAMACEMRHPTRRTDLAYSLHLLGLMRLHDWDVHDLAEREGRSSFVIEFLIARAREHEMLKGQTP